MVAEPAVKAVKILSYTQAYIFKNLNEIYVLDFV